MIIDSPYRPRAWQHAVSQQLKRFNVIIVGRNAGKTYFTTGEVFTRCNSKPGYKAIMVAPTGDQGYRIAWGTLTELAEKIPGTTILKSEKEVLFANGSSVILLGAKNYEAIRGHHVDLIVVDETEDIPKEAWTSVLRPAVISRKGTVIFIGTPKGEALLHELYEFGLTQPDWYCVVLKTSDLGLVPPEEVESLKLTMGETLYNQEMECSFTTSIKGAHFAHQALRAYESGRVRPVAIDPYLGVYSSWDIGYDGTVIVMAQVVNSQVYIIDAHGFEDKDIRYCLSQIGALPYVHKLDFIPHDAVRRGNVDSTKTPIGAIKAAGRRVKGIPRKKLIECLEPVRTLIDTAVFNSNSPGVLRLLKALKQYRSEYEEEAKYTYENVIKADHNHWADSFRYLALGLRVPKEEYDNAAPGVKVVSDYSPYATQTKAETTVNRNFITFT